MIYQLNKNVTQELSNYPESGMGYQYIEANIEGSPIYAKEDFIVLNGQFAILMDNYFESELKKISLIFFQYNIFNCPFLEIKNFKVLNPAFVNQLKFLVKEDSRKEQKPATENKKENANGDELFVRISAFEEDIRIDKKINAYCRVHILLLPLMH